MSGRPLRFLGLVLGAWVGVRVAMLWPSAPLAPTPAPREPASDGARDSLARPPDLAMAGRSAIEPWRPAPGPPRHAAVARRALAPPPAARDVAPPPLLAKPAPDPGRVAIALLALARFDAPVAAPTGARAPGASPAPSTPGAPRWSASAWLIARDGAGIGAGTGVEAGGQLGGSQAGARLAYRLSDRVALAARVAAPLMGSGSEAALGIEWRARPGVRLIAERRFAIDGAGGGPALGLVAGLGPRDLRGFRLEAYGQAGVIGRGRGVYYVDGAARIEAPLARGGGFALGLGAGGWGAAQSGAERLDLGPTLGATLPLGPRAARLTLDWRARVAGGAAPGSGPALSLGADF